MFKLVWWWGFGVGWLMGVEEVGRFLDRIVGIGLLLGRNGLRMVVGQSLVGQIHIRRGRAFLRLGLFGRFRSLIKLRGCLGLWRG